MNLLKRIQYSQNWNIGFCNLSAESLLSRKKVSGVKWLNHPYKDRWFADPFIYKVTDNTIVVFVEELLIDAPKGYLVELVIDRHSYRLLTRYVLLNLDTHLSYPTILEYNGKTYVYPENGASGKLSIYEYDESEHCLTKPYCIMDEALADATMLQASDSEYYIVATKVPDVQEKAYLFKSNTPFGPFAPVFTEPVQSGRDCSRPAGAWFKIDGTLYRPSQDCESGYGSAISVMKVNSLRPFSEQLMFKIMPLSYRYNLGTHTVNFYNKGNYKIAVFDGYGYFYPFLGRLYYSGIARRFFNIIKKFLK